MSRLQALIKVVMLLENLYFIGFLFLWMEILSCLVRGFKVKYEYGGRFMNYFSRHRATHIICNNLRDSKIENLRSFIGGLPVVKLPGCKILLLLINF